MNIASVGIQAYQNISSGKRINSAADDAAGLSIASGMNSQINGMDQSLENVGSMNDLVKTAEGGLSGVQDGLNRMRDLAVQAGNGILSDDDRATIQNEIEQIKSGIADAASNTEFNGIKLLDGSATDLNTALSTGSSVQVTIESTALENLGIADFDVTGDFSIDDIDNAMDMVTESMSNLGSASNAFDRISNSISTNMVNTSSSLSRIQDADMAEEISNLKKEEVINQYQMYAMKQKEEQERSKLGILEPFDKSL